MDIWIWKESKGKIGRIVVRTLLINTLVTLFVFYLILRKNDIEDLFDVFIISLAVLLCSRSCAIIIVNYIGERPNRRRPGLIISWVLLGSFAGSLLGCFFYYFSTGPDSAHNLIKIFIYTFVFGALAGACFYYYFYSKEKIEAAQNKINEEKMKRLTLEKQTALARMKILQAQIEPHFLFNTFSNIVSLFDIDIDLAKKMTIDLNEYLRISLQRTREPMVTLDQELELVRRYLEIFKVRMGRRLSYGIETFGNCQRIPFPPMILQPLVENAIRHGLEPKKEGGSITIGCAVKNNCLEISVADSGLGVDEISEVGGSPGIGLNNISMRLASIYGDKAKLTITKNEPTGVKAIIEVQL